MSEVYFLQTSYEELLDKPHKLEIFFSFLEEERGPQKNELVGLKVHFGEQDNKSYLNPKFLTPLAKFLRRQQTKPFLFDTNTLYRGKRLNSVEHINLAYQHGFGRLNLPIIIGDGLKGHDDWELPIEGNHFKSCYLASIMKDIDYLIVLSHFTLHMLTGFGATIKNLGMGCASRKGKMQQHCEVSPRINPEQCLGCGQCALFCPQECIQKEDNGRYFIKGENCLGCAQCVSICPKGAVKIIWSEDYQGIQEKMVEYAWAVITTKKCAYFNFCLFITKECDCMNKEEEGFISDLGVLFSFDPLALDKASLDLLLEREKRDFLKEAHPEVDYPHQLSYAHSLGLGSLEYKLINL